MEHTYKSITAKALLSALLSSVMLFSALCGADGGPGTAPVTEGDQTTGREDGTVTEDGTYHSDGTVTVVFGDDPADGAFNRISVEYKSTAPLLLSVATDGGGERVTERFYLEKSDKGRFNGLISGFLDGKTRDGIVSLEASSLDGVPFDFSLDGISTALVPVPETDADGNIYIENGDLRLGVRLAWGGGVSYISDKSRKIEGLTNLINRHDTGRLVQQSYYGTPKIEGVYDPGVFNGAAWNYNPVQGGDVAGNPSRLIDCYAEDGVLYVKTQPMDWAKNGSVTPSYMENTYTIDGGVIRVDNRFVDFSGFTHPYLLQELPAFYTVSFLDTFVYYYGKKPWTGDALTYKPDLTSWTDLSGGENIFTLPRADTESWAAWINQAEDFGIGVYTPGTTVFHAGRYRYDGSKDDLADPTNYLSPLCEMMLVSYEPLEYGYLITTGSASEIRQKFFENRDFTKNEGLSAHRRESGSAAAGYDMTAIDFSVAGAEKLFTGLHNTAVSYSESERAAKLEVTTPDDVYAALNYADDSADDVSADVYDAVEMEYMIPASNSRRAYTAELFLACGQYSGAVAGNSVTASLVADGAYHKVSFPASSNPCFTGNVNQLRLDYFFDCAEGDCIYVRSFRLKKAAGMKNGRLVFDSGDSLSSIVSSVSTDAGYDEKENALRLTVTGFDVNVSPATGSREPLDAGDYSAIAIEYMVPASNSRASYSFEAYLCAGAVTAPTEDNAYRGGYICDGGYHTLEIPLSGFKTHDGVITSLRYDYFAAAEDGDVLFVRSISFIK